MSFDSRRLSPLLFSATLLTVSSPLLAATGTLRIATYNMDADIQNDTPPFSDTQTQTTPRAGFNTVLEAIGNTTIQNYAGAVDILALEETTSNATTVAPVVADLNADYGAGTYAQSTYQGKEEGNDPGDGNGPNAIVYNTTTLTLLASVGVGTPTGSGNGEYRQVVRYEFETKGSTTPFYVYVSHMKSGTTSAEGTDRAEEATIIRTDENTLPAGSSILVMGDLNADPSESSGVNEFANLTATGNGKLYDPLNPTNSSAKPSKINLTDSPSDLEYRDDYELMTDNVYTGTGAINYVSGSLTALGNNGTKTATISAELTASDHIPEVADYTYTLPDAAVPEPASLGLLAVGSLVLLRRRNRKA